MMTLPGILFLLYKSIQFKHPWLSFYTLFLSSILVKFHELSILLLLVSIVTQILTVWPYAKKSPKLALAFFVLIMAAIYPHLSPDIIPRIVGIWTYLAQSLFPIHFRPWFY